MIAAITQIRSAGGAAALAMAQPELGRPTDQAATLRELGGGRVIPLRFRRDRAIAVTGGKGGVGKSTLAVNLAVTYARLGASTLAIDADLGMADLNLLLGVAPEHSLLDVLHGMPIEDVLVQAHGIHLLPALNGSYALENIDDITRYTLFGAIDTLQDRFDTLIVDVAAGIGQNATMFAGAVADPIVVATPEALSLADAYACLKVLARQQHVRHAFVVPNQVRSPAQADEVVTRLGSLVSRFLGISITPLPAIPRDRAVAEAASAGVPLCSYSPDAPASRAIKQIARRIDALAPPDTRTGAIRLFWKRLLRPRREAL
jgi:flagellar biosynthesis protein FlhG